MDSRTVRELDQAVVDAVQSAARQLAEIYALPVRTMPWGARVVIADGRQYHADDCVTCDGAPRVRPVTRVRPIRVAPGVRERVIADHTHE